MKQMKRLGVLICMLFSMLLIALPAYAADCDASEQYVQIKNKETNRLMFSPGPIFEGNPGDEGGWLNSPELVGADANYYERARWYLVENGDAYMLKNKETNRLAFSTGPIFDGDPGDEGGWLDSPALVGADANYYNRAQWYLVENGDAYMFKNKETNRLAFSTGPIFDGDPGDEGGWLDSPVLVGADANYYNRAQWYITGPGACILE
ncbi:MAG: hypothetical protein F6J93_20375 [Oscillatoria sp. SIO1A7]|nr:hypothetical protein [Oscillatoria sp. SIO1A7]